jgi:hypothetical protein
VAGTAEGFWTGTSSNGYRVGLIILENTETWGIYTSGSIIYGALYGKSAGTGSAFSANGTEFDLVSGRAVTGGLTGTVVPRSTINARSTVGVTVGLSYNPSYESRASLASIAGVYRVSGVSATGVASNVRMDISPGGQVSIPRITDAGGRGCSALGEVAPRPSGKNVYNISITFFGDLCALGDRAFASGIAVLDSTVNPPALLALALTPSKQDGFIAVGLRN